MIEVSTLHSGHVALEGQCDVAPKATPQTATNHGQHIHFLAVLVLAYKDMQAALLDGGAVCALELTLVRSHHSLRLIENEVLNLVELSLHINRFLGEAHSGQYLTLGVILHVSILSRLQGRADESQQEGHNDNHHSSIHDGVGVAVGIEARLHFLDIRCRSATDRALLGHCFSLECLTTDITLEFLCHIVLLLI